LALISMARTFLSDAQPGIPPRPAGSTAPRLRPTRRPWSPSLDSAHETDILVAIDSLDNILVTPRNRPRSTVTRAYSLYPLIFPASRQVGCDTECVLLNILLADPGPCRPGSRPRWHRRALV